MALKTYNLPRTIAGVLFDIDNTLYDNRTYGIGQISLLVARLAGELDRPVEEVEREVEELRERDAREREGRRASLGDTFQRYYDIPIATSVKWREELIEPERFLAKDAELRELLTKVSRGCAVGAVTNNPVRIGKRTLQTLGIDDLLPVVSGLDSAGVSKPHPRPFEVALEYLAVPPAELLSVGDRYEIDIEPILLLGGGGALVEGREDLLALLRMVIERGSA